MVKLLGLIYFLTVIISLSSCQSFGEPCTEDGDMIESAFDCKNYYKCINGMYRNATCGLWSKFDYEKKECRWSLLAECRTASDAMDGQSCSKSGDIIASGTSCKNYYVCTNGKLAKRTCGFWKKFDIIKNECRWSFLSTCRKDNKVMKPCSKENELIASSTNCKEYYKCVNGEYIKQVCGIGQKFDINMNDCIWSFDATCKNSTFQPITGKTPTTKAKIEPSNNSAASSQHASSTASSNLFCSTCARGKSTTGVNDHCQYYCYCVNGKSDGKPKKCLHDNYFDTKLEECSPNENVCGSTPSSLPSGSHCEFVGDKLKYPGNCYSYLECSESQDKKKTYQLKSCGLFVFDSETKTCNFNLALQKSFPFYYYRCYL